MLRQLPRRGRYETPLVGSPFGVLRAPYRRPEEPRGRDGVSSGHGLVGVPEDILDDLLTGLPIREHGVRDTKESATMPVHQLPHPLLGWMRAAGPRHAPH